MQWPALLSRNGQPLAGAGGCDPDVFPARAQGACPPTPFSQTYVSTSWLYSLHKLCGPSSQIALFSLRALPKKNEVHRLFTTFDDSSARRPFGLDRCNAPVTGRESHHVHCGTLSNTYPVQRDFKRWDHITAKRSGDHASSHAFVNNIERSEVYLTCKPLQ